MDFLRKQFIFLKRGSAAVLCLFLTCCSGSNNDSLLDNFFAEEDIRQQVVVPESFNENSIQELNRQVDSIFTFLHKKKGFNGTVLVTKYDQVIYKGAFGYADFGKKDTLTTQTAFQLASVSKQFTAMAIMMLKEKGKLTYDDEVQQYYPAFPYKGITIRHLLTHRSGLPDYTYFSEKHWPDRKKLLTNEDVLNLLTEHQPNVYYKPDKRFFYSNTGYMLLAAIVEKASGMPYESFVQKHIFERLNMVSTFTFDPEIIAQKEKVAIGHTLGKRKRMPDFLDSVLGDKGIYSTVEDLFLWDQALYTQRLVKWETLQEAFTGTGVNLKKEDDYGFGWRIRQVDSGDTIVYHGGLWHGYNTYLLRNPKDHSAIIVLSNLTNGSLNYMKDLRKFLYPAKHDAIVAKNEPKSKAASARL